VQHPHGRSGQQGIESCGPYRRPRDVDRRDTRTPGSRCQRQHTRAGSHVQDRGTRQQRLAVQRPLEQDRVPLRDVNTWEREQLHLHSLSPLPELPALVRHGLPLFLASGSVMPWPS